MIQIVPRRPFYDDQPIGLVESDRDFVNNNLDVCVTFLEGEIELINKQLLEALERITNRQGELHFVDRYEQSHSCRFCGAGNWMTVTIEHKGTCPFAQARDAIAKAKGEK